MGATIGLVADLDAAGIALPDRLSGYLIRKNEALSLFADPKMWDWEPVDHSKIWTWAGDGGGVYRNPVEFAKREMQADEPCEWPHRAESKIRA